MHTLVLGGIRSGKSTYAEHLVAAAQAVTYVATAADRPGDAEWQARLAAHRERRPPAWRTQECGTAPTTLPDLVRGAAAGETLLVDDLGGWLTALHDEAGWADGAATRPLAELTATLAETAADVVLVSPEVGLTIVPENRLARRFADLLGTANQAVAAHCDSVVLVVAGQPLWIKSGARGRPRWIKPGAPSNLSP